MHCNVCISVARGLLWGKAARNLAFRVEWLQLVVKHTSCVRRCVLAAAKPWSSPQCNGCFALFCVFLRIIILQLHGVLESLVANRIVMAACMLHVCFVGGSQSKRPGVYGGCGRA